MQNPREVAGLFYKSLVDGDKATWISTLKPDYQKSAERRGSSPYFWWETGRRYAEKYGVYYEFSHEADTGDPNRKKYFFKRKNPDGTDRGLPVPIYVIKIGDEWYVDQASI